MRDKTMVLCRGLPGSGKTTIARFLAPEHAYSADDLFEQKGGYEWSPERLKEAHAQCQERTETSMRAGEPLITVHNTFSRRWEAQEYFDLAEKYGYSVFVLETQNNFENVHGVPKDKILQMRLRWESLTLSPIPWWITLLHRLWRV